MSDQAAIQENAATIAARLSEWADALAAYGADDRREADGEIVWWMRKAAEFIGDPDYSPSFQDEYQRLWHTAAAERDALASDLETAQQERGEAQRVTEDQAARLGELTRDLAAAVERANTAERERDQMREALRLGDEFVAAFMGEADADGGFGDVTMLAHRFSEALASAVQDPQR